MVVAGEVEFVADEEEGEVGRGQGARVVEEGLEGGERRVRGDVVDQDRARRAAVVGARDGAEALCAGCVPELVGG